MKNVHVYFLLFNLLGLSFFSKSELCAQCSQTITSQNVYNEDFSGYNFSTSASSGGPSLPTCWDYIYLGTPSYEGYAPHIMQGSDCPNGSGNSALVMTAGINQWYGTSGFAILPPFTNALNTLEISFVHTSVFGSATGRAPLSLGYLTDATDASTFTQIEQFENPGHSNGAASHVVNLSAVTAPAGARLAFCVSGSSSHTHYIDDIQIRLIPSCLEPTAVSVSQTTTNSALVSWSDANGASSWQLEYGPAGFTLGNGTTVTVSANPFTLSGLNADTEYDVYVRTLCSTTEISGWSEGMRFRTICNATSITSQNSYSEDFSNSTYNTSASSGGPDLPACWDYIYTGVLSYEGYAPHIMQGSDCPNGSGNSALVMTAGISQWYGTSGFAILPPFTNALNTLEISFVHTSEFGSATGRAPLSLGYLTDVTDASTFTQIEQFENPGHSNGAASHVVNLSAVTAPAGARLAFCVSGSSSHTHYIDDIQIRLIPSCLEPTAVSVSQTTTNSALVSWSDANGASSWQLEYGPAGFTLGNGTTVTVSANPFTLSGLNADTEYDVYVRTLCSTTEISGWSEGTRFRTICNATSITSQNSYSEDFSNSTYNTSASSGGPDLPACWDYIYTGVLSYEGYAPHIMQGSDCPNGSGNSALVMTAGISQWYGTSGFAILPPFTNALNTLEISFVHTSEFGSATGRAPLSLGYLTDATDASTFTQIEQFENPGHSNGAASHVVNLSAVTAPAGARLAFCVSGSSSHTHYIDDIQIRLIPSCLEPTAVSVSQTTANSALVSWSDANGASSWQLEYGPVGFTLGNGTTVTVSANPFTLSGLNADTEYDVYVRTLCSTTEISGWSEGTRFRTDTIVVEPCEIPVNVNVTSVSPSSVSVGWTVNGGATAWQIEYGISGFALGTGMVATCSATPTYIVGLVENTTYDFYVRSVCSATNVSDWSAVATFTTDTLPVVPEPCVAPHNIAFNTVTASSVSLAWNAQGNELSWNLEYGPVGFVLGTGTRISTTHNYATINNLSPNTEYNLFLQAVCSVEDVSEWSNAHSIQTQPSGISEQSESILVRAWPNPTSGKVYVACEAIPSDLYLYDSQGQLLKHQSLYQKETLLDFSSFPAGMYFIRVFSLCKVGSLIVVKQ